MPHTTKLMIQLISATRSGESPLTSAPTSVSAEARGLAEREGEEGLLARPPRREDPDDARLRIAAAQIARSNEATAISPHAAPVAT